RRVVGKVDNAEAALADQPQDLELGQPRSRRQGVVGNAVRRVRGRPARRGGDDGPDVVATEDTRRIVVFRAHKAFAFLYVNGRSASRRIRRGAACRQPCEDRTATADPAIPTPTGCGWPGRPSTATHSRLPAVFLPARE